MKRPRAYLGRGNVWWQKKDYARALADYRAAVEQVKGKKWMPAERPWSRPAPPYLHLAAAYAACPDAKLRDPAKAIAVAKQACEAFEYGDPDSVQVLAALHAHAGDFDAAIACQTRAVKLLAPGGVLERMRLHFGKVYERKAQQRLQRYRQRKAVWDFEPDDTGPARPGFRDK